MKLEGQVAIVTGGAAGIGAATAERFALEGARVVIADRDAEAAAAVAARLGACAIAVPTDVRSDANVRAMVAAAQETFGGLNILVNNAGRGLIGTVLTTTEQDWDDLLAVNVKSVYLCSRYAIPVMAAGGGGAIVNIASNVAAVGIRDRAAYVATKGAVAALTRAMALDHIGENIRVNAVCPGVVRSSYFHKLLDQVNDPEAFVKGLEARAPIGRMGQPDEIASMILWLASDESSFAVGGMFTVDGGMTTW